ASRLGSCSLLPVGPVALGPLKQLRNSLYSNFGLKKREGGCPPSRPSRTENYCSAANFSHATSVPGSPPPAGSKRTTPDSSEQNVRWPVVPTVTGTAEASNEVFGLAAVPAPPAPVAFSV